MKKSENMLVWLSKMVWAQHFSACGRAWLKKIDTYLVESLINKYMGVMNRGCDCFSAARSLFPIGES
jgi:hypothetical protein